MAAEGPDVQAQGLVIRRPASWAPPERPGDGRERRAAGLALQNMFSFGTLDHRGEPAMP